MSWFHSGITGWLHSSVGFELENRMGLFGSYVRLESEMGQILVTEDVSKRGVNGKYSLLTNHLVPLHFLNQTPERHLGMEPPPLPSHSPSYHLLHFLLH
jgi:hypothetical protein